MKEPLVWHLRPVFITSTFRDMDAERDWLRARVFPELEERLRDRFCHLESVDLRWGVSTLTAEEEESRETIILKVVLNEIERSRPFLIGLLGDRYGWQPPGDRIKAAAGEVGFEQNLEGKSITELEILYGVLECPNRRPRSRFYLREPLPYDSMRPEDASRYSDRHNPDPAVAGSAEKLDALKKRLRSEMPERTRFYRAEWDARRRVVHGLETWGRMVLEDLWVDLEAETQEFLREAPSTRHEKDRRALAEFVEDRTRGFIGREGITKDLMSFSRSPAGDGATWAACVTGTAGTGKSSLFGHLIQELRKSDTLVLAHAAGINPGSTQIRCMLLRWIEELAAVEGEVPGLPENCSSDELDEAFASLLERVSRKRRVVMMVDALDQFERTARSLHVTWVPRPWPRNARLIATAKQGAASRALVGMADCTEMALPPISQDEAAGIVHAICKRHHRIVEPPMLDALLSKSRADGRPAHENPLWLELATEELNLLDTDDFARAEREFRQATSAGERLLCLLLAVVEEMPCGIEDLYEWMLLRSEKLFGKPWAQAFMNLISVSRSGWRVSDLSVLMPKLSGRGWDTLEFATLRRAFRAHIVKRGPEAQWDFSHAQMRIAVRHRAEETGTDLGDVHLAISEHLLELPREDPVRETETMYHLLGAGEHMRAAEYYGGDLSEGEIAAATDVLAELGSAATGSDSASAGPEREQWLDRLENLLAQPVPADRRAILCHNILFSLHARVKSEVRLETLHSLWETVRSVLDSLCRREECEGDWVRYLAIAHERIGVVQAAMGTSDEALRAYRESLRLRRSLAEHYTECLELQRDVSVILCKIGRILEDQGDLDEALRIYREEMEIAQHLRRSELRNKKFLHDLSLSHSNIGDVLIAMGDPRSAEQAYRQSLEYQLTLSEQEPGNRSWMRAVSVTRVELGNALSRQQDHSGALRVYREALPVMERMAEDDPGDRSLRHELFIIREKTGTALMALGDHHGALREFYHVVELARELVEADPRNVKRRRDLSVGLEASGDVRMAQGESGRALYLYEEARDIHARLVGHDPKNAAWASELATLDFKIGAAHQALGDLDASLASHRAALAAAERVADLDASNAMWQRNLIAHRNRVATLCESAGNLREAADHVHACLAALRRMKAKGVYMEPALHSLFSELKRRAAELEGR